MLLIIQIQKVSTMSAVSIFVFSALQHQNKMHFLVDNPNTKTADNVCTFRIWIIGSETAKKMRFTADNPNMEAGDNVDS